MSHHNYTNPAFCQNSEFYPVPSAQQQQKQQQHVESIYNRSLQFNINASSSAYRNPREGPLRMQRSLSTRSFKTRQPQSQLQLQPQDQQQSAVAAAYASGRYALVPLEELAVMAPRYVKSQEHLESCGLDSTHGKQQAYGDETDNETQFTSLPPMPHPLSKPAGSGSKIKHAFSSDFGSKTFLIVDKNSNQRYQMVPTAEDEELVDDNQEIIQMHNGRAHRYAVIPQADEDEDENLNDETCLSYTELAMRTSTPQHTPQQAQQGQSAQPGQQDQPGQPGQPGQRFRNPAATRALHELLSTPRKVQPPPRSAYSTPRNAAHLEQLQRERRLQIYQSQQHLNFASSSQISPAVAPPPALPVRQCKLSPQRLHYETVKPAAAPPLADRTMAVISPRMQQTQQQQQQQMEQDCNKSCNPSNNSYPQKLANATITLAVVSLMLVLGSTMNAGLIIYMIAHFGKSFYLQFGLVASFCGVGLGFLGFRSRHCTWLPNRSYTSGYILVTVFCLFKCCGLLVILVLDPFPGLPLHDVTTGVILGLSTFTMFFIGLGVIGSLWCYRPPPDNRVNVV